MYADVQAFLEAHGAREIAHLGGTLSSHLEGTVRLLEAWGSDETLCIAGLCHATYGTDGFPVALLPVERREELRAVAGTEAEALVYTYAAADREFLYAQLGRRATISFRDRFTRAEGPLAPGVLARFVELTFANELELARRLPEFRDEYRAFFVDFFRRCRDHASAAAYGEFETVFGAG